MLTLYFNRSFSATSFLISSLKSMWRDEELRIVISHGQEDPYLIEVADVFLLEPDYERESYLEFILDTCDRFNVDVFFPRKHVNYLAQQQERFTEINVHVTFIGNADVYELFDHKLNASLELRERGLTLIPESALVRDYETFTTEYHRIRSTSLSSEKDRTETVCLKPNIGIGGKGFMRISHHRSEFDDLFRESLHSIAFKRLDRGLSKANPFPELLLSTYLSGEEVSVDCIGNRGELLAAYPRVYLNKYEQRFEDHSDLTEICRAICKAYHLSYLFNVQFKRHRGEWYFIELNTRSAAGAHRICALDICPLSIALNLCLGRSLSSDLSIDWGSIVRRIEKYESIDKQSKNSQS